MMTEWQAPSVAAFRQPGPAKLGVVVNPVAGLGGSVGLKGTDGDELVQEALRRGASPHTNAKAVGALTLLSITQPGLQVFTASGEMGEDAARDAGFRTIVLHCPGPGGSTAADTIAAASAIAERGVDLLLFVGGDGTARDVLTAVEGRVPILGVPAGVKMHSAGLPSTLLGVEAINEASGGCFSDFFHLLKVHDQWTIVGKIFHTHV